ncbi:MAG: chaperone modulator CbpM [Bacteroidales bacterium]|nr:chaperone modulator CbpM [Bacteroidales bacterium]MBK8882315.1 chaperone modulator CbpM [Bacteroidales bacterium]
MRTDRLIAIDEFCYNHNIEISFINSLDQSGLIEVTVIGKALFITEEQLHQLEKIVRFHYELDINLEGIETINHLLQRMAFLQNENLTLRNRLRIYESDE